MAKPIRILMLEDNIEDAELVEYELQNIELDYIAKRVMDKDDFIRELKEFTPDLILSDYDLPQYTGSLALSEARKQCPDTPFILVSGAVTEDRAIEILTQGAKDYVLKSRLEKRLGPAVRRVLTEVEEHRARLNAENALRESERQARKQLEEIRSFYDLAPIGLCFLDLNLRYVRINRRMAEMNGRPAAEHIGRTIQEMIPAMAPLAEKITEQIFRTGEPILNCEIKRDGNFQSGSEVSWLANWMPMKDAEGKVIGINVTVQDNLKIWKAEETFRNAYDYTVIKIRERTAFFGCKDSKTLTAGGKPTIMFAD